MRKGMTFEIGAGAFTVCAAIFVFGVLTSAAPKPSHQTGKSVGALLVVEKTPRPSIEPSPSPTPGAPQLPNTSGTNPPSAAPTSQSAPTAHPTAGSKPTPTPTPVPDRPPVVVLSVSPNNGSAPLTVVADASGSTDTDGTPIASFV